jgi:O-antigen ligase
MRDDARPAAVRLRLPVIRTGDVDDRSSGRTGLRRATEWALLALIAAFALKSLVDLDATATLAQLSLLSLPKIAGAAFLALLAAHMWQEPRDYRFDRSHALLCLFLVLGCLSTVGAKLSLLAGLTTFRYAAFVALYVGLTGLARDPLQRTRIALALVASCAIAAAVAIATLLSGRTLVASTPFGEANDLAFLLATTLPLAIWLARRPGAWRPHLWAMTGVIALATLLTFSRGALVGIAAGLAWLVVVERRYLRQVAAGAAVVALVVAVLVATNYSRFRESYEAKRNVAKANVDNRLAAWRFAAELARDHPLVGAGPGNFGIHYERYWRAHPDAHHLGVVHNSYLEIASEMGIPALAAFLAFCATVFGRLYAAGRHGAADPAFLLAVRVSMVIAAVAGVFVSEQLAAPLWVLAGLATATWQGPRQPAVRA